MSETWHMVYGKKILQVCHIDEINFCYGYIDAINVEEKYENIWPGFGMVETLGMLKTS